MKRASGISVRGRSEAILQAALNFTSEVGGPVPEIFALLVLQRNTEPENIAELDRWIADLTQSQIGLVGIDGLQIDVRWKREDDDFIDALAADGVAYVPFFPLCGFSPLQSSLLSQVPEEVGASAQQVALAWLLQLSPNILVIAGTSSPAHLRENFAAADLALSPHQIAMLDSISAQAG